MSRPSPYDHGRSEIHGRKGVATAIRAEKKRLGARLRELRVERGLTQAQAAELVGVHPVSIARMEGGAANITVGTLVAVGLAYRVPLASLFSGVGHG